MDREVRFNIVSRMIKTLDKAHELLDSERSDHEVKEELLKRLYRVKDMVAEEIAVLEGEHPAWFFKTEQEIRAEAEAKDSAFTRACISLADIAEAQHK